MNSSVEADRWQQINALFHDALALDAPDRDSYLQAQCSDDGPLRREVELLIESHLSGGRRLDEGGLQGAVAHLLHEDDENIVNETFGHYRIIREIGRGGMGRVYLASRVDQDFQQQVAVKLIKRGMDTDGVIRRFKSERSILASLEHPNIARLIDGGTTATGLPYLVMEYVEGQPIDQYCAQLRLSIDARLELFQKVCAAVIYAHRQLVIHRDIKPSNILVTPEGEPKLLDFGVARVLGSAVESDGLTALTGIRLMTPDYASPEQIGGMAANTLSDVYSLGVVLYKLLTGVTPNSFRCGALHELLRVVRDSEPKRPSGLMIRDYCAGIAGDEERAFFGDTGTRLRLRRLLRGDLDSIVMMAIRKEPERRYQSVDQLAADLRYFTKSLPVMARDDTLRYRFGKFTQRHSAAVAAGILFVAALIVGILAATLEANRAREQEAIAQAAQAKAEHRFNEVRSLAHSLLFDYPDAIKNLSGATPVRERLVRDSLQYLNSLSKDAAGDTALERELANAYERVSEVEGGSLQASRGDTAGALRTALRALQLRTALVAKEPRNAALRGELAASHQNVGSLFWETGDLSQGASHLRDAVSLYSTLLKEEPKNVDLQIGLIVSTDRLGMLLQEAGNATDALASFERGLELDRALPASTQATPLSRRRYSVAYEHIGLTLFDMNLLLPALENIERALALRTQLLNESPNNADFVRILQASYYYKGEILAKMGRTDEALAAYQKDVALGAEHPDPGNRQSDEAYGVLRVGDMLLRRHQYAQALIWYRRARGFRLADVKSDPANLWKKAALIESEAKICKAFALARQGEQSKQSCTEALKLVEGTTLDASNAAIRSFFADTYSDLGIAAFSLQQRADALRLFRRAQDIWQDLRARNILAQSDAPKLEQVGRQISQLERR